MVVLGLAFFFGFVCYFLAKNNLENEKMNFNNDGSPIYRRSNPEVPLEHIDIQEVMNETFDKIIDATSHHKDNDGIAFIPAHEVDELNPYTHLGERADTKNQFDKDSQIAMGNVNKYRDFNKQYEKEKHHHDLEESIDGL